MTQVEEFKLIELAENGKASAVREATSDYIKTIDPTQLRDYFHAAGFKAVQSGDGGAAWMLRGVINGPISYGDNLRAAAVSMLYDKPRMFKYFPADFTNAILSRVR